MHYSPLNEFITLCKIVTFRLFCLLTWCGYLPFTLLATLPQSPGFEKQGSDFIYGGLKKSDTKEDVLSKLRKNGFIQIYEERDMGVVRCAIRWDGFRYELVSKFIDNELELCLIEGNKGWQDFHYQDVVAKEWKSLRNRLSGVYGESVKKKSFPDLIEIPVNDLGGVVTDLWELDDRLIILSVRRYETKDCCTDQLLEFSCCTLLIKPISPKPASSK